ncbi:MAG: GNAT family N-acetyltransferase [Alphaproteobacteria bacterium]|nr:GNAT family N-acetyltransferase [Alphaproteobacteria bacterium]
MKVVRLTERHAPALEELLLTEPLINLFLLGYMDAVPIHRGYWYGVVEGDLVRAVVLLVPGRLAVPWSPDPEHAARMGETLRRRHRPCMLVGPRDASDALWSSWGYDAPVDRFHDQHLYVSDTPVAGAATVGFRRAVSGEWPVVARHAAAMELEDIGRRTLDEDVPAYEASVQRRIESGQTWVIQRDAGIVFQINVGTSTRWGVQVGGTYVPPALRGHGLATAGMSELGRRLLPHHPAITLHVNEANVPAVRTYEKSGYRPHAPYRLLTLRQDA